MSTPIRMVSRCVPAKVRANASKRKAMSYGRMVKEERRLQAETGRALGGDLVVLVPEDAHDGVHAELHVGPLDARLTTERRADLLPEASEGAPRILHRSIAGPEETRHRKQISRIGSLKEPLYREGRRHGCDGAYGHRATRTTPHDSEQE